MSRSFISSQKIKYVQFLVILVGIASSFWTYILHIQLKAQVGRPLVCDVDEVINCSKIIGSSHGEVFGFPLGIYGIIFWLIAFVLAFKNRSFKVEEKFFYCWELLVSIIGFIFSLILMYISYFVLSGICEFCSVVQLSCIFYFVTTFLLYKKRNIDCVYKGTKSNYVLLTTLFVTPFVFSIIFFMFSESFLVNYYKENIPVESQKVSEKQSNLQIPLLPLLDNLGTDYFLGDVNAPVELIEFTDFECPYCQLLHERINELKPLIDSGKLKVYFRNWPLSYHKYSKNLAIAAYCSGVQGKFWAFADWSFDTAKKYSRDANKKEFYFSSKGILKKASSLSLNISEFKSCLVDDNVLKKIIRDGKDAQQLGGDGTPFIILNSSQYKGNWLNPEQLKNDILKLL